jgi:hypothetical protein
MQIAYYTCLNNRCPKHRNVFVEGDPQHLDCGRKRVWLEGQRPDPRPWVWIAPAAVLAIVAAAVMLTVRSRRFKER